MSAIPKNPVAAPTEELNLLCLWLAAEPDAGKDLAPDAMLQIAIRYAGDPDFYAGLERQAAGQASAGSSLPGAIGLAIERLNAGLAGWYAASGDAQLVGEVRSRYSTLAVRVPEAIARAFERAAQDRLDHVEGADRGNVEAILDAIKRINNAANSSLDLRQTTELSARAIAEVMQLEECSVFILDEGSNRLVLHATHGLNRELVDKASLAMGEGITGAAAVSGKPIAVRDAWSDPRFRFIPNLYEEEYRSILVVPIVLFTVNRLLGVLSMHSREYRDFTGQEIEFVETAAGQLAMAMWNARLFEQTDAQLHHRVNELTTLQRIGKTITSSLDYHEVLDTIVHRAAPIINADKAAIFEVGQDSQRLFIVASHGLSEEYTKLTLGVGEGVVSSVLETRQPAIVEDALTDPRLVVSKELIHKEGYKSMLCVPLIAKDRVLGAISVYKTEYHQFSQDEIRLVQAFADQAAIAMENARLYQETRKGFERNNILLRELNHRVKNNLQTVASLLTLQARHTRSKEAASLLALSAGRIGGMVAVHDLLSGRNLNVTTVIDVVQAVMDMARSDAVAGGKDISFNVRGDRVEVGPDKATVVALVVNELIWNAITHGFGNRDRGAIDVSVQRRNGAVRVGFTDDGRGLPPGFSVSKDAGLGLDIIRELVTGDLAGEFDIRSENGTIATVVFKI